MLVYSVECRVDADVAQQWKDYFVKTHLRDVFDSGCFTGYSFREDTEKIDGQVAFVSEYYCPSQEKLAEYNAHHAAALKQDIMGKFSGKFTASRRVFTEIVKVEKH